MTVPPLQFNINTAFNDEGLMVMSWLETRFTFTLYQKGGWLSGYKFVPTQRSFAMFIDPLRLGVWYGLLPDKMNSSPFPTIKNENLGDALNATKYSSVWLHDLGQWETVNGHQWEGVQPIQRKASSGQVVETEDTLWDIAASADAERILAYRGHNRRDDVYRLNVRLNQWCDYWRSLIDPVEEEVRELMEMDADDDVSVDTYRSERGELYNHFLDNYRETPPPWDN